MQADERTWEPPSEVAKKAMKGVRQYLVLQRAQTTKEFRAEALSYILANWNSYACQVIGQGKHEVVLNFFPKSGVDDPQNKWNTEEIAVKGGGAAYFRVSYNPEKDASDAFWFNAPK